MTTKLYRYINKLKCKFGYHKWEGFVWGVEVCYYCHKMRNWENAQWRVSL